MGVEAEGLRPSSHSVPASLPTETKVESEIEISEMVRQKPTLLRFRAGQGNIKALLQH